MENDELLAEVRKSQEGTTLAWNAISDVLTKTHDAVGTLNDTTGAMSGYISKLVAKQEKDEEDAKLVDEEEEEKKSFDNLVKALLASGFVTKDMSEPMGDDSKESKKTITSKPDEQQEVIQAAVVEKQEEEEEEKKPVADEEEEKEKEEEKEYPEVEKLKKAVAKLEKGNEELKKSIDEKVEEKVDGVLRKMGIRKEQRTFSPKPHQLEPLGADEDRIVKGSEAVMTEDDRVGELKKMSYAEIRKLQIISEADQLPEEFKKYIQ